MSDSESTEDAMAIQGMCRYITRRVTDNQFEHTCIYCKETRLTSSPRHTRLCYAHPCPATPVDRAVTDAILKSMSLGQQAPPLRLPTTTPSWIKKIKNFSKAAIGHVLNGSPTCTQQQINERLRICHACPEWIPMGEEGSGTCGKCGCSMGPNPFKYLNKLAWADQQCPLDPPKWKAIK